MRRRPDTELIVLARQGSGQAVEVLFDRYWSYAWRTAYAVTADRALADDAAQEAIERRSQRSAGSTRAVRSGHG